MDKKMEKEKRQLQEQLRIEVEEYEKEEEGKYEKRVEQMKKEMSGGSSMNTEIEI